MNALDHLEKDASSLNSPHVSVNKTDVSTLKLMKVSLANVDGENLSLTINDEIKTGEHVLITDKTGTGAQLFKAIAGLWPWGSGEIQVPRQDALFFMPPRPYLPTKSLYEAICYPKTKASFDPGLVEKLLIQVGQKELVKQLNKIEPWEQILSNEQQQCLGVARVLLHKPQWLFIQEALDSLTPKNEVKMLELLAKELPHAGIVTMTNQPDAEAFHKRKMLI